MGLPVGDFIPGRSGSAGIQSITELQRKQQQGYVPIKPPVPERDPIADAMAAQQRFAEQQAKLNNQMKAADLQNYIENLRASLASGEADINASLGEVGISKTQSEEAARRENVFDTANMRASLGGRGLALSGIRLGAEGRQKDALIRALGGIGQRAQSQSDALRRALENLQGGTARGISQAQAQLQALGV